MKRSASLTDLKAREQQHERQQRPPSSVCAICTEPLRRGSPLVGLLCTDPPTHVFHRDCIQHWRANTLSPTSHLCPVCQLDPTRELAFRTHAKFVQQQVHRHRAAWQWGKHWTAFCRFTLWLCILLLMLYLSMVTVQRWIQGPVVARVLHAPLMDSSVE